MSNYTILPGDLLALAPLISAENDLYQMLSNAPSEILTDFMAQVDSLSFDAYPTSSGSQVQNWVEELFTTLSTTKTTAFYGSFPPPDGPEIPTACVYLAYAYSEWISDYTDDPPDYAGSASFWVFAGDLTYQDVQPWPRPQHSAAWSTSISQAIELIENSPDQLVEQRFLSFPTYWPDYENVPKNSKLWSEQAAALQSLQGQSSLAAGQCPFLLYLLLAQTTSSDANDQKLVNTISNATVSSPELPNSTFAEQLVYFTLMYLNDPRGSINWTNQQILDFVSSLIAAIPANSTSKTLSAVLADQQKYLKAYASYPGIDPNNPAIPFNERYSDVLAAINMAWMTIFS